MYRTARIVSAGRFCAWRARSAVALATSAAAFTLAACSSPTETPSAEPPETGQPPHLVDVAVGSIHACVLDSAGTVWCWGATTFDALGVPGLTQSTVPVQVPNAPKLVSIGAGSQFTCGLDAAGAAWCWGSNVVGTLGNGDLEVVSSAIPVRVGGDHTFTRLVVGERHTCGIDTDGRLLCWGGDAGGGVGTEGQACGPTMCAPAPVAAAPGLRFATFGVGLENTCGVTLDGKAYCWGFDSYHQGGDGERLGGPEPKPVARAGFVSVEPGTVGSCALDAGGAAWCWGTPSFNFGTLGTGTFDNSTTPVAVTGNHRFVSVVAGHANDVRMFNCGIDTDGTAWCWGENSNGQLGTSAALVQCYHEFTIEDTGYSPCSATPVRVEADVQWSKVGLGGRFACGLTTTDDLYCWGRNSCGAARERNDFQQPGSGEGHDLGMTAAPTSRPPSRSMTPRAVPGDLDDPPRSASPACPTDLRPSGPARGEAAPRRVGPARGPPTSGSARGWMGRWVRRS